MLGRLLLLAYILGLSLYGEQLKDDLINLNRGNVVMLSNMARTSGGTGFYVKAPSGKVYTMTNAHVCRLAKENKIISFDGESVETLEVVQADYENNDLCLLTAPSKMFALRVASSSRNGENISVIGHPLLQPKTMVKGQISGRMTIEVLQGMDMGEKCKGKTYREEPLEEMARFYYGGEMACIRTTEADVVTAFILPGNSGSPVLDLFGHVVGVVYAGQDGTGRGFIVPLNDVKEMLKDR